MNKQKKTYNNVTILNNNRFSENENEAAETHIHDIGIPRPKCHDIEIPRPRNRDFEIRGLKHHDNKKQRQLSHDIVIPRHLFRGRKATTSRFQD